MLRKISRTSMERLAAFLGDAGTRPGPAAPSDIDGIRVAAAGYTTPATALAAALMLADSRR
jgi:hypothetical protein